ncbi:MAG: zinc-binding dehydrogenase [SAR86 cluster bacterium]|jgi:S-(hydroxymethyl)glutathione dehydrogenase / alcohol dehydrogenase|nr:zinc-binding dehydrogenase [SAR86 cluster bacterium]
MKAAVLVESGKPLQVDDINLPDRLEYGQVKVKILYSGICGAQINEIDAVKGPDKFLPHLLGHEASGQVLEVAEGVTTVKTGDHVVLHWRPSSGIQSATPKYKWKGKEVNAGWVTTFNEEAIISENRLTSIPKEFDMRLAPLFGCAVTTAFGVVNNDAELKIGQSLVVFGLGGVGLNIIQAASMVSANPIIGIDLQENKIEMAKRYGLTHGIVGNSVKVKKEIIKIIGEKGADVVIETTGNSRVIEQAYDITNGNGKTILVGVPKKGDNISIYSLPLHFKKILKGSEGGSCIPDVDIPRYINLMQSNKMTLDGLITHEFRLDEINDALELFRSGSAGRILINMQNK